MSDNNSTRVEYEWEGAPLNAGKQTDYTFTHGGDSTVLHVTMSMHDSGAVGVNVLSTGPEDRQALANMVNLLQSLVAQEAMEYAKENHPSTPQSSE